MALLGTAVGFLVTAGMLKVLPRNAAGVGIAVFAASVISVVLASQGFLLQYVLGGDVDLTVDYGQIAATLAGVHALIGVGEGLIGAITVVAVARVRPDLVHALRGRRLDQTAPVPSRSVKPLLAVGAVVVVLIAGGLSYLASSAPDGLDSTSLKGCTVDEEGTITGGECIAQRAQDHELAGGLFADYGIEGIDNATGVAGVLGVLVTFAVGLAVFWAVRRRRSGKDDTSATATETAAATKIATATGTATATEATESPVAAGQWPGRKVKE
jgi:cobalt/nickel transport system permease protein